MLVGFETSDDAAVYRLTPDLAMVSTVDYITPPVDDPWWFGQIAAANSLSDIYAMGGKPLTALNLVMFPSKKLDLGLLKHILRGGSEKIIEARASMAGGHSVDDKRRDFLIFQLPALKKSRLREKSSWIRILFLLSLIFIPVSYLQST